MSPPPRPKYLPISLSNPFMDSRSVPQVSGRRGKSSSRAVRGSKTHRQDINNKGSFGEDEEDLILRLYALLGNRWSLIAGRLPGRTDKEVKSFWKSHLSKKLIDNGIDPRNHRALLRFGMVRNHVACGTSHSATHAAGVELSDTGSNDEGEASAVGEVESHARCDEEGDHEVKKPTTLRLFF